MKADLRPQISVTWAFTTQTCVCQQVQTVISQFSELLGSWKIHHRCMWWYYRSRFQRLFCNHCSQHQATRAPPQQDTEPFGSQVLDLIPDCTSYRLVRLLYPFHAKWRVSLKYVRYLEYSILKSLFQTTMLTEKALISPIRAHVWHSLCYWAKQWWGDGACSAIVLLGSRELRCLNKQ